MHDHDEIEGTLGVGIMNDADVVIQLYNGDLVCLEPDAAREIGLMLIQCANKIQEGRPGCPRG